jgi:ABC-type Mn2+/Zn2+ transport system permease subunit
MTVIIAIISTLIVGILGAIFGYENRVPELGAILAIATMGGFILYAIRKKNKSNPTE